MNTLLGTSGEDTLLTSLIAGAESLFNGLVNADPTSGLISASYVDTFREEDFPNIKKRGIVFFLRQKHPTAVSTVNGVSAGTIDVNFILKGQRLEFETAKDPGTTFPFGWKIAYTAGYASNAIPDDIELAIKYIVAGLYNRKNSEGFDSFRQDLLSVNYSKESILDTILDPESKTFVQAVVATYKVPLVIS